MPASGPSAVTAQPWRARANHLARTVLRRDQLVARLPDREQPHRQVGDAGVGELLEPRQDRLLVAGSSQIADVARVPTIEQLLIVGRRLGLGEDAVGAVLRGVDLGVGAQTHRNSRDDARCRAARVVGGLVDPRRDVLTDRALVGHPQHRPVGEFACDLQHYRPERGHQHRHRRLRAEHRRVVHGERGVLHIDLAGPCQRGVEHLEVVAGVGGGLLVRDAEHVAHDPVMRRPDAERQPSAAIACTDSAWRASAIGCCACSGTTAVPSSMRDGVRAISATMVRQSKSLGTCGIHAVSMPARLGPLDVVEQLVDLAGHVAALGPDHHAKAHSLAPSDVSLRTSWTRTSSGVPVGKTAAAPASSSFGTSACGNRAADDHRDIAGVGRPQRVDGAGRQRHMRAGEDRKPHQRNVFLQRDRHDVLDALADAGVDHLETRVAQRAGDDLGATIMPVEAGFGDEYAGGHLEHHRLLELAPHRFERRDHFAHSAVGVGAVDQLVHQVVGPLRRARQGRQTWRQPLRDPARP